MRKRQYKQFMEKLNGIERLMLHVERELHEYLNERQETEDSTNNTASALMQAGIDNIMGYQWPPKRGDNG